MSPQLLMAELPMTREGKATVMRGRSDVQAILHGDDDRLVVIMGPCCVHDPSAALEYAQRLKAEACRLAGDLCLVMRMFFEPPRATDWKGLIFDPALDQSFMVNTGLRMSRKLLQEINHLGIPCAVGFLDTATPQFLADLVAWGGIGAQSCESTLHRDMASGLSMPVGFASPSGDVAAAAVDACAAALQSRCFFGDTKQGTTAIVHSLGNPDAHIVLPVGGTSPHCPERSVGDALARLEKSELPHGIIVDCTVSGPGSDYRQQSQAAAEICQQLAGGQRGITGVLLQSNLVGGCQQLPLPEGEPDFGHRSSALLCGVGTGGDIGEAVRRKLRYGVSVAEPCIDWTASIGILERLAEAVRRRRQLLIVAG